MFEITLINYSKFPHDVAKKYMSDAIQQINPDASQGKITVVGGLCLLYQKTSENIFRVQLIEGDRLKTHAMVRKV